MTKILFFISFILLAFSSFSQDNTLGIPLLKYDLTVDMNIILDLDKRKFVTYEYKSRAANYLLDQAPLYSKSTLPYLLSEMDKKEGIPLLPVETLSEHVKYKDDIPCPMFAKRTLKKKCVGLPYQNYLVTRITIAKPSSGLLGNKISVKVVIEILDQEAKIVATSKAEVKLEKSIKSRDFDKKFSRLHKAHYHQLYKMLEPSIEMAIKQAVGELVFPIN